MSHSVSKRFGVLLGYLLCCCLLGFSAAYAQSAKAAKASEPGGKIALVIGNSAYHQGALTNPVNDAQDIAAALRKLGFKVIKVTDASKQAMRDAVKDYTDALNSQSVALFFYAGHGIQINGRNYIIPVDANIRRADDVEDQSVALDWIMQKMEARRPHLNIVILDACRNNPFARSFSGGLAAVDAPAGSLIAFSTAPSKVAADGSGRNGLYTSHLLHHIDAPNLKIEDVFKKVRHAVIEESEGTQIPWENTSLTEDFVFNPQGADANAGQKTASGAAAMPVDWLATADQAQIKRFLTLHPVDDLRDAAMLQYAKFNARSPLRQAALGLGRKHCDQCPRMVALKTAVSVATAASEVSSDLVTDQEYGACVTAGKCRPSLQPAPPEMAAVMPVRDISLEDAARYVAWLNGIDSTTHYLIPSAEQWLAVYRSGYFLPSGRALAEGRNLCEIGNFYDVSGAMASAFPWASNNCNDGFPNISPVGAFLPSLDGIFDLVGNLWQWTSSCADETQGVAPGPQCKKAYLMGGSWATAPRWNWKKPPQITVDTDTATDLFGLRLFAQHP